MRTIKILGPSNEQYLKDISSIHAAIGAMFDSGYSPSDSDIKDFYNELHNHLTKKTAYCAAIIEDQKIISYLWANIKNDALQIMSLWTEEAFRKQGLAEKLKKQMEDWAIERNILKIDTTISINNTKMLELNQKLGYQTKYYRMEKTLSKKAD